MKYIVQCDITAKTFKGNTKVRSISQMKVLLK